MFDFRLSTEQNKQTPLDNNSQIIAEKTVEVLSDTTITIDVFDWKMNE